MDDKPAVWKRLLPWLLRRQTLTIEAPMHLPRGTFKVTGYRLRFEGDENLTTHNIVGNRFNWWDGT